MGGNVTMQIQICTESEKNEIGGRERIWETVQELEGFLDLFGGDSKYTIHNAKIQESPHIFMTEYEELDSRIKPENSRAIIDGMVYDVKLIDDVMGLHEHYEIYLSFIGGQ